MIVDTTTSQIPEDDRNEWREGFKHFLQGVIGLSVSENEVHRN